VSHEAFGYLCDAYGLTQIPITGMDAEGEPDAQTMASIIDQVKAQGVKTIFSEDLVSPKVAQAIADATGATCEVLNPLEGLEQDDIDAGADYVSVMRDNLDKLVAALS
jgi:zinc transport system substrate-binding protein